MTKFSKMIAVFAVISGFSAFAGPVQARETHDNSGSAYATYSPQMAERGQRFYVGHDD